MCESTVQLIAPPRCHIRDCRPLPHLNLGLARRPAVLLALGHELHGAVVLVGQVVLGQVWVARQVHALRLLAAQPQDVVERYLRRELRYGERVKFMGGRSSMRLYELIKPNIS